LFRIAISDADLFLGLIAGIGISIFAGSFQDFHPSVIFWLLPSCIVSAIFLGGKGGKSGGRSGEEVLMSIIGIGMIGLFISGLGGFIGYIFVEILGIRDVRAKSFFFGIGTVSTLVLVPWVKSQNSDVLYRANLLSTDKDLMHEIEEQVKERRSLEKNTQANQVDSKPKVAESKVSISQVNEGNAKNGCTTEDERVIDKDFELSTRFEIMGKLEKGGYTKAEIDSLIADAPYLGLEREDIEKIYRHRK
tara:strand:+ start:276 stop:1019 length:744 start_codon:yes stop_codon:yes gene_type:complete